MLTTQGTDQNNQLQKVVNLWSHKNLGSITSSEKFTMEKTVI